MPLKESSIIKPTSVDPSRPVRRAGRRSHRRGRPSHRRGRRSHPRPGRRSRTQRCAPPEAATPPKLPGATKVHAPAKPPSTPPVSREDYARASEKEYRRLEAEKARSGAKARAQLFADIADDAFERGDMPTAAQHYRLAIQVHVDSQWFERLQIARSAVAHTAAAKRAREAEAILDWKCAAESWDEAYTAKPDASCAERLAHALLQTRGDVRRAVALAQQATLDEPHSADIRVTLAEALLVAGLVTRARTEVNRVLERAPDHERAKAIATRVRKAQ
ncbi:MAG: tetratricopeptide repeat protein [Polyangiales bacterium]